MSNFSHSELSTLKIALQFYLKNSQLVKFINTNRDEELLRKIRIMLGEGMDVAGEEGSELAKEAIHKIRSKRETFQ